MRMALEVALKLAARLDDLRAGRRRPKAEDVEMAERLADRIQALCYGADIGGQHVMKCIELIPGIKLCAERTGTDLKVELDVQGHKVWGTTLHSDGKCVGFHLSVWLVFSCKLEVCFDGHTLDCKGEACLLGKCSDIDVHIDIPT